MARKIYKIDWSVKCRCIGLLRELQASPSNGFLTALVFVFHVCLDVMYDSVNQSQCSSESRNIVTLTDEAAFTAKLVL